MPLLLVCLPLSGKMRVELCFLQALAAGSALSSHPGKCIFHVLYRAECV